MNEAEGMRRALALATRGIGHTRPNPPVGAVILLGGEIVGEGWHRRAGGDHAEVAAIRNCRRRYDDIDLSKAVLCVTLEPCSRPGRVGACTDAIAAAGIGRVVYAVPDPNPANRDKAKRALARAGIPCERLNDDRVVGDCRCLIAPFAKHVVTGLPFVTVKLAMSLDGRICDSRGDARWISSAASRRKTGRLREKVDAVMVGAETVRRDDPSLLSHFGRNDDLHRVIVSASGRLPKLAQVFTDAAAKRTHVFSDAAEAVRELGRMGFLHVLCEGGLKLATSLAEAGLVDEWIDVVAPIVIGSRPIAKAIRFPGNDTFAVYGGK